MNSVKMAYLLTCHKNAKQVNMFIEQLLKYGDCDIYIHIDAKNKLMMNEIIKNEHVHCYSKYDVRWGSYEIVLAGLYLMQKTVKSGIPYTHVYYGSGQDLIVKKGLYEYLNASTKKVFITIDKVMTDKDIGSARYRICWPRRLMIRNDLHPYRFIRIGMQILCKCGIVIHPNKIKIDKSVKLYQGKTWFVASIDVIKYIVNYCNTHKKFMDFWKTSLAPDLMFFQTIIMNSPYKNMIGEDLVYINWGQTFSTMNHPLTISLDYVNDIKNKTCYFARKFDIDENADSFMYFIRNTGK